MAETLGSLSSETHASRKPEVLAVTIRRVNATDCEALPHFVARRGSKVVFRFDEYPDAELVFQGASPFSSTTIKPGAHVVTADAPSRQFAYKVSWGGNGSGNGTGEVIT